jgi:hypothetical protein
LEIRNWISETEIGKKYQKEAGRKEARKKDKENAV